VEHWQFKGVQPSEHNGLEEQQADAAISSVVQDCMNERPVV
jgi:hypothetical protein